MNRRKFLGTALAAGLTGPALYQKLLAEEASTGAQGAVPRREYKPGVALSVIGFGGIIVNRHTQDEANREVAWAIERWDPLESTCRHASLSIL